MTGGDLQEHLLNNLNHIVEKKTRKIKVDIDLFKYLQLDRKFSAKRTFSDMDCSSPNPKCRVSMSEITYQNSCGDPELYQKVLDDCLHADYDSKCIAVVGQSGIGKTQLVKSLLKEKKFRESFDYVFYVSLANIDCNAPMHLLDFLTNKEGPAWIYTQQHQNKQLKEPHNYVVEKVVNSNVCIVFDEFEKTNYCYKTFEKKVDCYRKHKAGFFISNILRGDCIRNALKIVVVNPSEYHEFTEVSVLRFSNLVIVLGIDHDGQESILKTLQLSCQCHPCCSNKMFFETLIEHHSQQKCCFCKYCYQRNCHHETRSLCCVPSVYFSFLKYHSRFNCTNAVSAVILMEKLKPAFACGNQHSEALDPSKCYLKSIGKFAWKQYSENKIEFFFADLTLARLTRAEINIFFNIKQEISEDIFSDYPDHVFFFLIFVYKRFCQLFIFCLFQKMIFIVP